MLELLKRLLRKLGLIEAAPVEAVDEPVVEEAPAKPSKNARRRANAKAKALK